MTDKEKEFKEFKLIHKFIHPDEHIKAWYTVAHMANQYKEDINCLLPVMEKISKVEGFAHAHIHISYTRGYKPSCFITLNDLNNNPTYNKSSVEADTIEEATYKAIVQFIKWYNKHGKTNLPTEKILS